MSDDSSATRIRATIVGLPRPRRQTISGFNWSVRNSIQHRRPTKKELDNLAHSIKNPATFATKTN